MKYIDTLGQSLKSDFLNDLFETYEVTVSYEYDRSNENMEDQYHAEIPEMGLQFLFDATQKLICIFMKPVNHSGYNPFDGEDPREAPFNTGNNAVAFAKEHNIPVAHQAAKEDAVFGSIPEWAKFNFGNYSIHYQFNSDGVEMVTLQVNNA